MKNDIEQIFKTLGNIASKLDTKVWEYARCFCELHSIHYEESYFRGKIKEKDKKDLENIIAQLETDIQTMFEEFLKCTNVLSEKLNDCEFLDFSIINELNYEHFEITRHYKNVIDEFQYLKQRYKDYDFSWIDFSKMEKQKMKLNIAIKKVNEQLLGNCRIQLMDMFEMEKELFQFSMNKNWKPSWEKY